MSVFNKKNPFEVLLVEDSETDAHFIKIRFSKSHVAHNLHIAENANVALDFLRSTTPKPHIILLDLGLPDIEGNELLKMIKQDTSLHHIIILVITSSEREPDVITSQENGANGYIIKPSDAELHDIVTFYDVAKNNADTWVCLAKPEA